ncbi:MAG TPA: tryptophan--tRNA ligase [Pyrinomonadaceae bacterium]
MRQVSLTGIKPTGTPHIGNYLGAILPAIELARKYDAYYFIADYHALTTVKDGRELQQLTYEVACTWLALGLDTEKVIFFRQSDIPQIFELSWVLACVTAKGLLNRAHAYKAYVDRNTTAGKTPDDGINAGIYNYPVLMAADILMFRSDFVPVGLDQKQHVEIARDIALAFNSEFKKKVLKPPAPLVGDDVKTVPGLDGRKMSKNYGNTIPIFAPPEELRKRVMRIVTDSKLPAEPKDPDTDNIFAIYKHFATPEAQATVRAEYERGGKSYAEMKQQLFELLDATFAESRIKYNELMANKPHVDQLLHQGAEKARVIARGVIADMRKAIGAGEAF